MAESMRALAVRVPVPDPGRLLDIVGTGGDNLGTFNISTTAALVAAGAGAKVAKHGNRAASSRCGAADVLEALGVVLDLEPRELVTCLDRVGMMFMLASRHHAALAGLAPVRRALGIRTVFNFLGPLTNPASARRQLLGVSAPEYVEILAGALAQMGARRALVVHGLDGMDELSVAAPSRVVEVSEGMVGESYIVQPADFGMALRDRAGIAGGDAAENAAILRQVLGGGKGAPRDAVLLNAGAALYAAGITPSIATGIDAARESIDSRLAQQTLEALIAFTRDAVALR